MRDLIETLCSDQCAGRAPGTPGGLLARGLVAEAFQRAGLEPSVQDVPAARGANVYATLRGETDRWVLVGAHYDHLGKEGPDIFRGADDNAAAVAIMVDVAGRLARERPQGRGVVFVAFDSEEPPHFRRPSMGSAVYASGPPVGTPPLEKIDMMVCMDLVGHAVGPEGAPEEIRRSVIAMGAERSAGTAAHVDRLARAVPGVVMRRMDAEAIPPLSDYDAFWEREVPFLFLSCGRWRWYHTPQDTPDRLDYPKIEATARWLERFVRETCARPEPRIPFRRGARDDASTLRTIAEVCDLLAGASPEAALGGEYARSLLAGCDADGALPEGRRSEAVTLVERLQAGLA